jgi:hypothetical protein
MTNRRELLPALLAGLLATAVLVSPALAEEIFGAITSVDLENQTLRVRTKDNATVELKITESTVFVAAKGDKLGVKDVAQAVARAKDAGKSGTLAKVSHENKVALKVTVGLGSDPKAK